LNQGTRLASVFTAPGRLFEDLKENQRGWWVPFVIFIGVIAVAAVLPRLLLPTDVILDTIRQNMPPGVELDAEQMEKTISVMRSPVSLIVNSAAGAAIAGIQMVAVALFFWALFAIVGGRVNFSKSMAVTSYTGMVKVVGVLFTLALVLILKRTQVFTSLALLPFLERGTFLFNLAAQFDFFSLWRLALMGYGFSVVLGISKTKGYITVLASWFAVSILWAAALTYLRFGGGMFR